MKEDAPLRLMMRSLEFFGRYVLKGWLPRGGSSITLFLCAGLSFVGPSPSRAGQAALAWRDLDRIAYAVDGAESSHGTNPAMWQLNPSGPQGPMQVSEKAARDVGWGNRFDITQNRAIGRAYLALLRRHYGNWPDAVSAYNWGMGNLDSWIRAGRPSQKMVPAVAVYSHRVLAESGLCRDLAYQDCIEPILRNLPFTPGVSRNAGTTFWFDQLAIPGLEQSGRPLAKLASSGNPLPNLAQSGKPLSALEQSGRPLSLSGNRRTRHRL